MELLSLPRGARGGRGQAAGDEIGGEEAAAEAAVWEEAEAWVRVIALGGQGWGKGGGDG